MLLWRELKAESSGLFVKANDEVALIFLFVLTFAGIAVLLASSRRVEPRSNLECENSINHFTVTVGAQVKTAGAESLSLSVNEEAMAAATDGGKSRSKENRLPTLA